MKLTLLPLEDDNLIRVRCEGHMTSPHLLAGGDPLEALLGPHCYGHRVLFDLERVRSIDTGGVCWLLRLEKMSSEARGRFVLYGVPGVVVDVLELLRLTPMLRLAADEAAARELAARPTGPTIERFPRREAGAADASLRQPG
jgi:hypothetical protein